MDSNSAMTQSSKLQRKQSLIHSAILISLTLIIIISIKSNHNTAIQAQSIGPFPNVNLGFNPYLSPVFGYGLSLPFGAYGISPLKFHPKLSDSILGLTYGSGNPLMSSIHAKTILKKIAPNHFTGTYPYYSGVKDKLNAMKHPEYAFAAGPYSMNYGFGRHYGSAVLPNNPYKSAYGDYYGYSSLPMNTHHQVPTASTSEINTFAQPIDNGLGAVEYHKHPMSILKPLIKAGAFLTTMAILGKKTLEPPARLNPSGMILNGRVQSS